MDSQVNIINYQNRNNLKNRNSYDPNKIKRHNIKYPEVKTDYIYDYNKILPRTDIFVPDFSKSIDHQRMSTQKAAFNEYDSSLGRSAN